jgi:8-oxo-dGTP pyrophosphatase MutT (NUDIX family)
MKSSTIIEREAARAIVLTPQREVLLLRVSLPEESPFWITPGGGIEPGESVEACLRRELREEVGLERFALGPLVWRRQHTYAWLGRRILVD